MLFFSQWSEPLANGSDLLSEQKTLKVEDAQRVQTFGKWSGSFEQKLAVGAFNAKLLEEVLSPMAISLREVINTLQGVDFEE